MDYALYIASVIGAIALVLMMPRSGNAATAAAARKIGALLGASTLGGLWLWLARALPENLGLPSAAFLYYYVFSAIAITAAVRVITHTKPVYAALWFVMVVLSSSGLFLTVGAEFMALAMVIIYGGAILVTYVFVIMLAARADEPSMTDESAEYDRVAREPFAAAIAGFVLLAVLLSVAFDPGIAPKPVDASRSDEAIIENVLTNRPEDRIAAKFGPEAAAATSDPHTLLNVERVGLDLFEGHPLGLELAGVILLVSLIGAVVIARKQVDGEEANVPAAPGPGGATVDSPREAGPHDPETLESNQGGRLGG